MIANNLSLRHSDSDVSLEDARWRARVPISLSALYISTHICIYTIYLLHSLHFIQQYTFIFYLLFIITFVFLLLLIIFIITFYISYFSSSNNNFN